MNSLLPSTMKRKHEEVEAMEVDYTHQRQSILNISMCKLKQPSMRRTEPSLRRSVLIFNTLRHIEIELKEEGVRLNTSPPPHLLQPLQDSDMTLDPPPNADPSFPIIPGLQPSAMETDSPNLNGAQNTNSCTTVPVSISRTGRLFGTEYNIPPIDMNGCQGNQPANGSSPVASSKGPSQVCATSAEPLSSPSLLDISASTVTSKTPLFPLPTVSSTTSITSVTNVTSHMDHDALSDIDTSLLDFEFISSWTPSTKLSPLTSDDLTHAFPSSVSFGDPYGMQCFKNDLADDLDHIMQVLVGM